MVVDVKLWATATPSGQAVQLQPAVYLHYSKEKRLFYV